jgi:hypothetical protein
MFAGTNISLATRRSHRKVRSSKQSKPALCRAFPTQSGRNRTSPCLGAFTSNHTAIMTQQNTNQSSIKKLHLNTVRDAAAGSLPQNHVRRRRPPAFILAAAFAVLAILPDMRAQNQPAPNPGNDGGRSELRAVAASAAIQEELESPDGVALQLLPDGGFRIYGRGSGTYDFNEADEIRGATSDATLRAKAAIAKFLRERIQSADVMNNTSVKMKNLTAASGEKAKAEITKNDVQTRVEQISSSADEIMSGLVVISSVKKPIGDGGEIQVTIGWSSKTRATAGAIRAGKSTPGKAGAKSAAGKGSSDAGTLTDENRPKTKRNRTDF